MDRRDHELLPTPTQDTVLALFEKHRASPGSPYDERHFLDFLVNEPAGKGAVRNSFSGLRRYNGFLEAIQLEYGVCFSLKDRETAFSVDAFVRRIGELQRSPAGSLQSLSNQGRAGAGWQAPILASLVLCAVAYASREMPLIAGGMVVGIVVMIAWFVRFDARSRSYHRKLRARITELQDTASSKGALERTGGG